MPLRRRTRYARKRARPARRMVRGIRRRYARPSRALAYSKGYLHSFVRHCAVVNANFTTGIATFAAGSQAGQTAWTVAASDDAGGVRNTFAMWFQIGDLVNVSELSSLFDSYKVNALKWTFDLSGNVSENVATATTALPNLLWVPDYDDNTAPTNSQTVREYRNVRTVHFGNGARRSTSIYIKPRTNVGTDWNSTGSRWWDFNASTPRQFYGIKGAWLQNLPVPPGGNIIVRVTCKAYIQCKSVH